MRHAFAACLLLALAGCAAAPGGPEADGMPEDGRWAAAALPAGEGHDHLNRSQHAGLSTPNFRILGWDPLADGASGNTPGGHFCGDAQDVDGGRRLAVVEQRTIGGFAVMDVTDPADPEWLGELVMRGSRVYDMALAPDGEHVALVTTDQVNLPASFPATVALPGSPAATVEPTPALEWRTPCLAEPVVLALPPGAATEDPLPRPSSILLADISDPRAPAIVDQRPLPGNGHSAFFARIDGKDLLLVAALTQGNGYYQIHELVDTPLGKRLRLHATYGQDTGNPLPDTGRFEAHDGWIAKHPLTGQTLVYLAGGRHFTIVDATDPGQPREIGRWSDWSPERDQWTGHMHSVYPLPEVWDGRHFTVVGPEYADHPGEQPSGTMWMLDTTDPARPFAVGAWTLPYDVEWSDTYMFSNHYFTVQGHTAFVSMYHGGVWAVDLAAATNATDPGDLVLLSSIGAFLPPYDSPEPPTTVLRWTPTVQEVFAFPDGVLALFDGASGVYTVEFDAARPAPAPEPWPIPAPPAPPA